MSTGPAAPWRSPPVSPGQSWWRRREGWLALCPALGGSVWAWWSHPSPHPSPDALPSAPPSRTAHAWWKAASVLRAPPASRPVSTSAWTCAVGCPCAPSALPFPGLSPAPVARARAHRACLLPLLGCVGPDNVPREVGHPLGTGARPSHEPCVLGGRLGWDENLGPSEADS